MSLGHYRSAMLPIVEELALARTAGSHCPSELVSINHRQQRITAASLLSPQLIPVLSLGPYRGEDFGDSHKLLAYKGAAI